MVAELSLQIGRGEHRIGHHHAGIREKPKRERLDHAADITIEGVGFRSAEQRLETFIGIDHRHGLACGIECKRMECHRTCTQRAKCRRRR